MNNFIDNRKKQMEAKGFFTSETQKKVFDLLMESIAKSNKFESIGNAVLQKQMVEKTQILIINNLQEMFSEGWMLVKYFKYYAQTKDVNNVQPRNIWNVINAIETKDRTKFTALFVKQPLATKNAGKSKTFKPSFKPKNHKPDLKENSARPEITYVKKKTV